MPTIYRYEVSVDDQRPRIKLFDGGTDNNIVGVGCRKHSVVEFWAVHSDGGEDMGRVRTFIVVGTGHQLPHDTRHVWGHAIDGPFVWHLIEVA